MRKIIFITICLILTFILYSDEKTDFGSYSKMNFDQLHKEEKALKDQSDSYEKNLKLGLVYYFLASIAKEDAMKSVQYLELALTMKNNDVIRSYLGSAWTIAGGQAPNVFDKMKYVNKGTGMLDESYKTLGGEYSFLVLYVTNNLALPDNIFHRYKFALDGLNRLETNFQSFEKYQKAETLYLKADYLNKTGKGKDAMDLCRKITIEYKDTDAALKAKKMIDKYGE
jgi:hypothetical protein